MMSNHRSELTRRAPVPQLLPGGRIQRDDVAVDARRRVHHAIDDQRTDLHLRSRAADRSSAPTSATPREGRGRCRHRSDSRASTGSRPCRYRRTAIPSRPWTRFRQTAQPRWPRPTVPPRARRRRPGAISLQRRTFRTPFRRLRYSTDTSASSCPGCTALIAVVPRASNADSICLAGPDPRFGARLARPRGTASPVRPDLPG